MPTEPIENKTGDQAGKQKNQSPLESQASPINAEIDDDFGNRYLLGRQLAHEFNSPAVQALIQHNATIDNGLLETPYGDPEVMSQITASGNTTGQQAGDLGQAYPTPQAKQDALKAGRYEQRKRSGASDDLPLEDPWIDPTMAAAGGMGAMTKLSLAAGLKLMPSLGRGLAAGIVGGLAEYPIGMATEGMEEIAPGAALPFNVIAGMVSGVTLERAIEDSVTKLAGATGDAIKTLSQKVAKELASGDPKSAIGKQVLKSIQAAYVPVANQSGEIVIKPGELPSVKSPKTVYRGSVRGEERDILVAGEEGRFPGIHFGTTKEQAINAQKNVLGEKGWGDVEWKVKEYRLNIENPLRVPDGTADVPDSLAKYMADRDIITYEEAGKIKNDKSGSEFLIKKLKEAGHDGLVYKNEAEGKGDSYIVFDKKQILSPDEIKIPKGSGVPKTTKNIEDAAFHSKYTSATNFDVDIERKYAGNINLTKIIQEPEDIRRIIAGTADNFSTELETARRGKISWEQTVEDAKKYSLEDLLGRKLGQAYNDAEVENARTLLVSSSENLKVLRDKIMAKGATDQDKADFLNAFNMHYAIEMQVAGAAAEAGRALRAFGKMAESNVMKTRQIQETLQHGVGKFSADQIAEMMVGMDSVHQVNAFVKEAQKATTMDMLLEAWINGLLSGPQTHVVNTVSNALTALWQIPERALGAGISKALGTQGGVKTGEAQAQAWGLIQGAKDGFKTAARVLRTGEPIDQLDKIESRRFRAITAQNVSQLPVIKKLAPNAFQQGGVMAGAVDLMGEGIRIPGRFLGGEDEFFKSVGYRMELNARAYRSAIDSGLTDKTEIADHIAKILADPAKEAPDIHAAAIDAARYQTFTKELGSAGKDFSRGLNKIPALRFIVPFMRTPTNIIKFAGERTPVAWISKNVRAEIAAGGARRDMALAKMGMGTMAMTVIGAFAAQGMVTGGGPSDPQEMAAWRRTGWQPYSIKVGDIYVSYSRVEPMGMLFGLASDFVAISGLADENLQPEVDKLAGAILASISKNVTSKTWLEGVSSAIEAFDDPDRYMGRFVEGYVRSVVPTGIAQVERSMDPDLEAIYGMVDALKSRIPGLSSDMPKRRDLWGNKISTAVSKDRSWAEIASSVVNPFYVSKDKTSPIDKELIRLDSPIAKPKRVQSFDGVAYEMNAQQYDDFMVSMNTIKLMSTGKNLKDSLNDLVRDPDYKTMEDDQKVTMIRRYFDDAKREAKASTREKHQVMNQVIEKIKLQDMMSRSR